MNNFNLYFLESAVFLLSFNQKYSMCKQSKKVYSFVYYLNFKYEKNHTNINTSCWLSISSISLLYNVIHFFLTLKNCFVFSFYMTI